MATTTSCDPFAAALAAFADRHGMLPCGSRVLVALSGGRDSMALLTALEELAPLRALTLSAAHYDHGLRGAESRRDRDFVQDWCRTRGIPLTVGAGDVAARARQARRGIEETARAMRYDFLRQAARAAGADRIATAHNADDDLETILLHLVRGAGLDGLTGIPPVRGDLIRPLLSQPRRDIDGYLARKGVPWVEDSTNAQTQYARNRLRREVLPVLRELNPNLAGTLSANLDHLRADRDYLYAQAAPVLAQAVRTAEGVKVPAAALAALPKPVAARAVKGLLALAGRYTLSSSHLDRVLALAASDRPDARGDLPEGLTVGREYGWLWFRNGKEAAPTRTAPIPVPGEGVYPLPGGWTVTLRAGRSKGERGPHLCALLPPHQPLVLRTRAPGDRLTLPGRPTKTLKKWYIDEKIPRHLRDALPVLADEDGVVAAAGLGPQADRVAPAGTDALLAAFSPPEDKQRKEGSL